MVQDDNPRSELRQRHSTTAPSKAGDDGVAVPLVENEVDAEPQFTSLHHGRRSVLGAFFDGGNVERVTPKYVKPKEGAHSMYPYENIVFQGGGAKGMIYGGVIQALDELGILPHCKRFAGASAGTGPALFCALGLSAEQACAEANAIDMLSFFDGGKDVPFFQKVVQVIGLFTGLGMHPAKKGLEHFGQVLEKYSGDPDLTFLGLYQMFGRELCIAVSNVSRHQSEYCHVNTTPNMPIRQAIRASMSLPFMWEPMELFKGETYVDGGLFNNFPLMAFDGWFLSTKKGDDHVSKIREENPEFLKHNPQPHEIIKAYKEVMFTSFKEPNFATIGFRVSDDESPDEAAYATYLTDLETRLRRGDNLHGSIKDNETEGKTKNIPFPDTKLARAYLSKRDKEIQDKTQFLNYERAYVELSSYMVIHSKTLVGSVPGCPHAISNKVFIQKLQESPPNFESGPSLFGHNSWKDLVENGFDYDGSGFSTRQDMAKFWERYGIRHAFLKNRKPQVIDTLSSLGGQMLNAMYNVAEEGLLRDPNNAKRICSLSTKYVGLLDLELEQEDKDFLCALGKKDTLAWIKKNTSKSKFEHVSAATRHWKHISRKIA